MKKTLKDELLEHLDGIEKYVKEYKEAVEHIEESKHIDFFIINGQDCLKVLTQMAATVVEYRRMKLAKKL